ncbi:MAG: CPBP family intramembrane metalloprotease [Thermostichus sp. DG02_5_bins_236]
MLAFVSRSALLPPPQDSTCFEALKARHLLLAFLLINLTVGWLVVLLARVSNVEADEPLLAYIVYCLTFTLMCGWSWQRGRQAHLCMRRLWGRCCPPISWGSLVRVVLALVILSMGTTLLMLYLISLSSPELAESMLHSLGENARGTAWPPLYQGLRWLSIVAVAPVTEEWLFRGLLLHRWSLKWGIPKGLLASSVLFGLLHPNPIGLTVFGLVMGLFYLQARSLTLPILAHVLNNILALTLGSLGGEGAEASDPIGIFYLYYGLFCLILAGLILVPFIRFHWPERGAQLPYFLNG